MAVDKDCIPQVSVRRHHTQAEALSNQECATPVWISSGSPVTVRAGTIPCGAAGDLLFGNGAFVEMGNLCCAGDLLIRDDTSFKIQPRRIVPSKIFCTRKQSSGSPLTACQAPDILIIPIAAFPWSVFPAHSRTYVMDPAEGLSISSSSQKRAITERFSGRILPEPYPGDATDIARVNTGATDPHLPIKVDRHVLQDIVSILLYPWHKVFHLALLAPTPPLAAVAALPADLFRDHSKNPCTIPGKKSIDPDQIYRAFFESFIGV